MSWIVEPQAWVAFLTLTALEIVLGIDNVVFLSILSTRVAKPRRRLARRLGLLLAMATRILLLLSIAWIARFERPLFSSFGHTFSGRDLVLVGGGLFLLWKSAHEIHAMLDDDGAAEPVGAVSGFGAVLVQIALLDVVFSLDSVITAVGMVDRVEIMVAAIVASVFVMMAAAEPLSAFVERHRSVKNLALSFLVLVGTLLVADGFGHHVPRGYAYFAMAFSAAVEALNLRSGARQEGRGKSGA